jgi:hypothetical protein
MIAEDSPLRCERCHGVHPGHGCPLEITDTPVSTPVERVVQDDEIDRIIDELLDEWKRDSSPNQSPIGG